MRTRLVTWPHGRTIALDIAAWGVFHAATGYAVHRLDERSLNRDLWLLRPRAFEDEGRWYRKRLQIHRWKDRLPEAGALFAGGVSKRQLPSRDLDGLRLMARETRRAELGHWAAMGCSPLFVLWNPPLASALLISYGVAINLPFIAVQRYNRGRLTLLIDRRSRAQATTPRRIEGPHHDHN